MGGWISLMVVCDMFECIVGMVLIVFVFDFIEEFMW